MTPLHGRRRIVSLNWLAALGPLAVIGTLMGTLPVQAADPVRLVIVSQGRSEYVIAVPDKADPGRIAQAATLLQKTLAQATGAKLPVVKESAVKAGTPAFYLGKSRAAQAAGVAVDKVKGWAFLNQVVGKDVFLVGEDGVDPVKGRGQVEHLGTLKAVVSFLEDQVGVRFYLPGVHGTHVPKLKQLVVGQVMRTFWTPRFEYVIGRAPRDRVFGVALNLFARSPVLYTYGGHSYYTAVPAKKYGKTKPEYFILNGGVRDPRSNHLCISNPEVQELMLKEMEKRLDDGYQWVELAQTDGYRPCHCAACVAIHADPGERTWIVHRKLAEEMRKRRPGKKVMIISYGPTVPTPKTFRTFPDNVVVQMCAYTPNAFKAWAPFNVDKSVYIYNWGQYQTPGYAPKRTPRYAVEQVRLFLKNRVRGIYICGGFKGGQGAYGLEGPSYYAYGKALGDPERDPDDLLNEYVAAAFGEAAVPMRAFFTAMHDRLEMYCAFQRPNTPVIDIPRPFRTQEEYFCYFFPPNLVTDMSRNLDRAKAVAAEERVKANLRLVEIEFDYVKNLATVFQLYRSYRMAPSREALDLLGAKVAERKRMMEALFPQGRPLHIKGLVKPFMGAPRAWVERNGRQIGAPLNWDFALLRERGVLPGAGNKSVRVARAGAIKLDGRLDEPGWQQGQFEEMSEIGMGALKNATRFKILYDGRYVYFGFECEFDRIDILDRVRPVGHDGAAYYNESLEIMLDPYGTREKHCHFILNPVPNSCYDARFGFIEDPLHPLYGKRDSSWNGKWDYAPTIDKERKRWTAEVRIPFSTLEVKPPRPGSAWSMNVGRAEWRGGYRKDPAYSIWSPNLEARSFHDRSTFGDVVFK